MPSSRRGSGAGADLVRRGDDDADRLPDPAGDFDRVEVVPVFFAVGAEVRPLGRDVPDRPPVREVSVVTVPLRLQPSPGHDGDTRDQHGGRPPVFRPQRRLPSFMSVAGTQTVTMTGTIIGRCLVRSPTSFPSVLRATRFNVSWSWVPVDRAWSSAAATWTRACSIRASVP